jgi:hypothetical protein
MIILSQEVCIYFLYLTSIKFYLGFVIPRSLRELISVHCIYCKYFEFHIVYPKKIQCRHPKTVMFANITGVPSEDRTPMIAI